MSRYLTLEEAKAHLIVESDDLDNDLYIESLIETAEDQLRGLLNRQTLEEVEVYGTLPAALRHALKILVSNHYENREGNRPGRMTDVSHSLASLYMPWRHED